MFKSKFSVRRVWPAKNPGEVHVVILRPLEGRRAGCEDLRFITRSDWAASLCLAAEATKAERWISYDRDRCIWNVDPVETEAHV